MVFILKIYGGATNHIQSTNGYARMSPQKGESLWQRAFIDLALIAQGKALVKSFLRNE
jgi:hypothetical protein